MYVRYQLRKYAVVKTPRSVYAAIPGRNKYRPSQVRRAPSKPPNPNPQFIPSQFDYTHRLDYTSSPSSPPPPPSTAQQQSFRGPGPGLAGSAAPVRART